MARQDCAICLLYKPGRAEPQKLYSINDAETFGAQSWTHAVRALRACVRACVRALRARVRARACARAYAHAGVMRAHASAPQGKVQPPSTARRRATPHPLGWVGRHRSSDCGSGAPASKCSKPARPPLPPALIWITAWQRDTWSPAWVQRKGSSSGHPRARTAHNVTWGVPVGRDAVAKGSAAERSKGEASNGGVQGVHLVAAAQDRNAGLWLRQARAGTPQPDARRRGGRCKPAWAVASAATPRAVEPFT
jgi:hypothetical protein